MLKVQVVGVTDNFFVLGGHSLLATQVLSRVREAFGVDIPLATFFAGPTVENLAENIKAGPRTKGGAINRVSQPVPDVEQLSDEEVERLLQELSA